MTSSQMYSSYDGEEMRSTNSTYLNSTDPSQGDLSLSLEARTVLGAQLGMQINTEYVILFHDILTGFGARYLEAKNEMSYLTITERLGQRSYISNSKVH